MQLFYTLAAALLFSPATFASNVRSDSRIQDGRVQLILANSNPNAPVTIDRVEMPVALVHKRGSVQPAGLRRIPATGSVGEHTVIDLGTVDEVFNGGGEASETTAKLNDTTTTGMRKCLTRSTPVTVSMRAAGTITELRTSVSATFCHRRAD